MAIDSTVVRIRAGSMVLMGNLGLPEAPKALVLLASAGINDSLAHPDAPIAAGLQTRGFATLTVDLLTAAEETQEIASGRYHLDAEFLTNRTCLVLAWIRHQPNLAQLPLGMFVEGMATAAAIGAAVHHTEIGAIVSVDGRADLVDNIPEQTTAPVLLVAFAQDAHVVDLNRKANARMRSPHCLTILSGKAVGSDSEESVAGISGRWFDQHLGKVAIERAPAIPHDRATGGSGAGVMPIKNILVATDFSEPAELALRYGTELARELGASLHVIHVADDLAAHAGPIPAAPEDIGALQTALEQDAREDLGALVPEPDRSDLRATLHVAVSKSAAEAIVAYAKDASIDLLIAGTHGRRGLPRILLGSVAEHLVRSSPCPVLTMRAHGHDFIQPAIEGQRIAPGPAIERHP
jgi:putative phosphoribosyl transferase